MKLGIILTPDIRSKAYIQKLILNKKNIDLIILLNDNRDEQNFSNEEIDLSRSYGFDITKSVKEFLLENNLKFKEFSFVNINEKELVDFIKENDIDYYVFTGGGILKNHILNSGSKFIHFHPGITPEYRGSTCFYYSILNEGKCGVTAFVMEAGLDTGDIIFQKEFGTPKHKFLDTVYDPHIRSETLISLLNEKNLNDSLFKKQSKDNGTTYFIIHPVLKHIAVLKCLSND
tara:strand:+ start:2839 stop:3531 length:693 start_codon:yes stop_codon:yes gene_type:complete